MRNLLRAFALLACTVVSAGAYADGFGSSILQVSNFRLLDGNGNPYNTVNSTVRYQGLVSLRHGWTTTATSVQSDSPLDIPAVYSCTSGDCLVLENDVSPMDLSGQEPTFQRADQALTGALDNTAMFPLSFFARGDVVVGAASTDGVWLAGADGVETMTFTPAAAGPLVFAFDASLFVTLRLDTGTFQKLADGFSGLRIELQHAGTGATVFLAEPAALSNHASVTPFGSFEYDSGWRSFSLATPPLDVNNTYRLTLSHGAGVNFTQPAIPEPASWAMLAAGLALLALGRRRLSA